MRSTSYILNQKGVTADEDAPPELCGPVSFLNRNGRTKKMRMIDAEHLKNELREWCRENWGMAFTGDDACSEFDYMIDNEDTIETVPVVHAHWIPQYPNKRTGKAYSYECSKCKRTVYSSWQVSVDEMRYDFCPHCGAIMDTSDN